MMENCQKISINLNIKRQMEYHQKLPLSPAIFSVFLSNNRQICEADTDNISAINEETAIKYAQKINRSNKKCGFISKYRYMKENTSNGVKIYFLDCTKSMMSFQNFLVTSIFVSAFWR